MSGQHCESHDVKRETVHCYPVNSSLLTAVARNGWNLSAVFKFCFCFVLLYNKSLNDWSLGEQWILLPSNLNVSLDFVSGNIEILGKQTSLFPSGPVIKCLMFRATANCNVDQWITCVINTSTGINGVRLAHRRRRSNSIPWCISFRLILSLRTWRHLFNALGMKPWRASMLVWMNYCLNCVALLSRVPI